MFARSRTKVSRTVHQAAIYRSDGRFKGFQQLVFSWYGLCSELDELIVIIGKDWGLIEELLNEGTYWDRGWEESISGSF